MNEKKAFIKSTIAYFFGNILSKLIVFFMLPLYTAYISPADYGYYDLTKTYIDLFCSILFLDIWSGTLRFMFDSNQHSDKFKTIYSSLLIYGSSTILYLLSFSVLNAVIGIKYFPLVLIYGVCITLQSLYGYIARGFSKNTLFAISGFISTVVTVLLNIILISFLKTSYWSLYVASSIGILVQVIILELSVKLIPNFSLKLIDINLTKKLFRFSIPLCLNSAAYWFLTSYNRIAIVNTLGETQNGYFAVAGKFAIAINLVGTCFTLAWQETAFKKEGQNEGSGKFYSEASSLYVKFLFLGTICLIPLIGIFFKYIVNDAYISAKSLIPLSLLGTAISLYCVFLGNIFGAIKKNSTIFISTMSAGIANVAVIYLLINHIGVQAANISFLIGYTINCIIRVVMLNKKIGFKLSYKPIILYILLFAVVTYIFQTQSLITNAITLLIVVILTFVTFKDVIKSILTGLKQKESF